MVLGLVTILAGAAFASAPAKAPVPAPEETLRVMLLKLRHNDVWQARQAMLGGADELRDAVTTETGAAKKQMADRLPGMAAEPFDLCRDLAGCPEAPQSLHVEDASLIDDAFLALARPWFKLQKARGKDVSLSVEPGVGVQLSLQDLPSQPVVTLEAAPAPTGGFDVALDDGARAGKVYASERAALLQKK